MVSEYFFENPEVFAIAIGALIFVVGYEVLSRRFEKSVSALIALPVAGIAAWSLHRNDFYGLEMYFAYLMYIAVALIVLRMIVWPFVKGFSRMG